MSIDYKSWYRNAAAELARLRTQKTELDRAVADCDQQIAALTRTMNAIAPLAGEESLSSDAPPAGFTDSIRNILSAASDPLSAAEVRDRLSALGFDMNSYSNPLATIHTVLRRLVDAREAEAKDAGGVRRFAPRRPKGLAIGLSIARDSNGGPGIDLVSGKRFSVGKDWKGVIGVGRLTRRRKAVPAR
jgi:hypothetical protein